MGDAPSDGEGGVGDAGMLWLVYWVMVVGSKAVLGLRVDPVR